MTIVVAALAALILGLIGGPVIILAPWAAVAIVSGARSGTGLSAVVAGLVFGFLVSFVFLIRGYQGSAGIPAVILLFTALAAFGGCCGATLSAVGWFVASRRRRSRARQSP